MRYIAVLSVSFALIGFGAGLSSTLARQEPGGKAGSDFGWYCDACPVVVINSRQVSEMLGHSMPHWDVGNEFCVEGIVDLDAIPEHKRHLPIGGDDNPVPLIEFQGPSAAPRRQPLNKQERQQRKKLLARKLQGGRQDRRHTARERT